MNLLYIAFGNNPTIHTQIAFSIYSFLSQKDLVQSINVITDNEAVYKHLYPHIKVIEVTENELNDWKGKYKYLWRIKIKAIEKICLLYPNEQVVYLDGDTFLYSDLIKIKGSLSEGRAVMHEKEGPLSGRKTRTQKRMWQQVRNRSFGNIAMLPTDDMWNAGVIGIPNTDNGKDIRLVLTICDEMCEQGVVLYFIEQYAFSLALNKCYGLSEAKDSIAHYWSTRPLWNKKINALFLEAYFSRWDFDTIIEKIRSTDKTNIPVFAKVRNTGVRLRSVIEKWFPNENLQYLSGK